MTYTVNDEPRVKQMVSGTGFCLCPPNNNNNNNTRSKKESNAKEKASPPPTYSLLIAIATPCCALQSSSDLGNKIPSVSVRHFAGAKTSFRVQLPVAAPSPSYMLLENQEKRKLYLDQHVITLGWCAE
ncbi:hypothetical protein ACSS6W_000460 [Trichoderma asperelloides]